MMAGTKINFGDGLEVTRFLTIAMMPFSFSIADGIVWGILAARVCASYLPS